MAKLTPQEYAEKWRNRLSSSTQDIQRGVESVTVSPTEKAAMKKEKMKQNLIQAVDSGKWERGLRAVSLEDWRRATIQKGISRISQGASEATPKMQEFASKLIPYQQSLQSQIDKMPDLTLDQSIARMVAWTQGMSKFKK